MMWQTYPDAKHRRQVSECRSPSLTGNTLKHFKIQIRRFRRRLTTSGAPTDFQVWPSADIPGAHHQPGNGVMRNDSYSRREGPKPLLS